MSEFSRTVFPRSEKPARIEHNRLNAEVGEIVVIAPAHSCIIKDQRFTILRHAFRRPVFLLAPVLAQAESGPKPIRGHCRRGTEAYKKTAEDVESEQCSSRGRPARKEGMLHGDGGWNCGLSRIQDRKSTLLWTNGNEVDGRNMQPVSVGFTMTRLARRPTSSMPHATVMVGRVGEWIREPDVEVGELVVLTHGGNASAQKGEKHPVFHK